MKIDDEKQKVIEEYLEENIIGLGCYVTEDGDLIRYTNYPNAGTEINTGKASEIQIVADKLLTLLQIEIKEKKIKIEKHKAEILGAIIKKEMKGSVMTGESLALRVIRNPNFYKVIPNFVQDGK